MATWANDHTLTAGLVPGKIITDGTNLYFIDTATNDVWRYNLLTGIETQCLDASALANWNLTSGIGFINGNLYILLSYLTGGTDVNIVVQRWTGTLNGLATVYTVDSYSGAATYPRINAAFCFLYVDDATDRMVVVGLTAFSEAPSFPRSVSTPVTAWTGDGTTWNVSAFFGHTPAADGSMPVQYANVFPQGIYAAFLTTRADAFIYTVTIFKFSGGLWVTVAHDIAFTYRHTDPALPHHWTAGGEEHSTDLVFTDFTTPDATLFSVQQSNTPYSMASKINGANTDLYVYEEDLWVLLETISSENLGFGFVVKATNNEVFAVVTNGADYEIWQRSETLPARVAPQRLLGIAADAGSIYVTDIRNSLLTVREYDNVTLTLQAASSFGAAAYTDPDTFIKGLYPVVAPVVDRGIYLYGKDASNRQVLHSVTGAIFTDVGPGTATWGTAKFAVALMPAALNPLDMIVAFADNDVYRTETGTANWVKQGDATTGLRTAARVITGPTELLLGGTSAGTMLYTGNMGVSYAGGGTAAGTVNAIEVSR